MRKIKIGYYTSILASDNVLRDIASLLMEAMDEKGEPVVFNVEAAEDPAVSRQREENKAAVKKEMEEQGKDWLSQYQRAEKAEAALRKMKEELRNGQESQA